MNCAFTVCIWRNLVKQRLCGQDLFLLEKYLNYYDMPDRHHSVLHLCSSEASGFLMCCILIKGTLHPLVIASHHQHGVKSF